MQSDLDELRQMGSEDEEMSARVGEVEDNEE